MVSRFAFDFNMFTQEMECQYCRETRQISEEVASLSDNISVEVYDFVRDQEIVEQYNINKIPALYSPEI